MKEWDAVIIGAGPNGLAAAIRLKRRGLKVLLIERSSTAGGGARTQELTLPGYQHDVCSAVHPLAVASPYFQELQLDQFGLEYILPEVNLAHPFDDQPAALLTNQLSSTADSLGRDSEAFQAFISPLLDNWPRLKENLLGPLRFPKAPGDLIKFGSKAIFSAKRQAGIFEDIVAKGFWSGLAAHSMLPLHFLSTAAIPLVLLLTGLSNGWPIPKGGAQSITNALVKCYLSEGGELLLDQSITSLDQLPPTQVVLFNLTPRQVLRIAGDSFSKIYTWQLRRYQYGMGVFKIDWALDGVIPFSDPACRKAGTLHLGASENEIQSSEKNAWNGRHSGKPFVLLSQPSVFDAGRAPAGKHTAWAYCHVPNGSKADMTAAIEDQVERFAPGFKKIILARNVMNTTTLENYNPNYIGGDINGGAQNITQLFTRPAIKFNPYRTSDKRMYFCSSSTPPGGGVHGMCGYHSAGCVIDDWFN